MQSRYKFIIFFFLSIYLLPAHAQKAQLGLKTGLSASSDFSDIVEETNIRNFFSHNFLFPRFTPVIGVYFLGTLNDHFIFESDISIVDKGITYRDHSGVKIKRTYLHFPQTLKYVFPEMNKNFNGGFYAEAGGYFSYIMHTENSNQPFVDEVYTGETDTQFPKLSKQDWGAIIGIGYYKKLEKGNLIFDLRFERSLIDTYYYDFQIQVISVSGPDAGFVSDVNNYHRLLVLSVGYSLGL